MSKQVTLLDLDYSAADAAAPLVNKDQLTIFQGKLAAWEQSGLDPRDFSQWSQFFDSHLQNDSMLIGRSAPSTLADQAAAAAAKTNPVAKAAAMLLLLLTLAFSLQPSAFGGVYQLTSVGPNIPAITQTNFTTLVPIGTFTLNPQNIYFSTGNSITNPFTAYGRLTFDGTNFFTCPQFFVSPTNAAVLGLNGYTNLQWSSTNIVLTVYAALSVTNSMAYAITNFQAGLQY